MSYAVVDIETTGLSPGYHHRIVEIAVVLLDRDGTVTNEWCTLLNPERDLGPQHIHGIQAIAVRHAPTFREVAADLAKHLMGRVIVAHNLLFDLRFLVAEYGRLNTQVPLNPADGLCTMHLSGRFLNSPSRSLTSCCTEAGIDHTERHSALHDARACAKLLSSFLKITSRPEPWIHLWAQIDKNRWPTFPRGCGRTCQRNETIERPTTFLASLINRLPRIQQPANADDYLALLDRALLDRHLSASEQDALIETAETLNLTFTDTMELHRAYLADLATMAWQDGVVNETERSDLLNVADLLGLTAQEVDIVVDKAKTSGDIAARNQFCLKPGNAVAFTGQMPGTRDQWERQAALRGLKVSNTVTRTTRLLVAADPDSPSGKAKKARQYGIPIIAAHAFENLLNSMKDHS